VNGYVDSQPRDDDTYLQLSPRGELFVEALLTDGLSAALALSEQELTVANVLVMLTLAFWPQLEEGHYRHRLSSIGDDVMERPAREEPGAVEVLRGLGLELVQKSIRKM
jgi:hypothetical protein